MRGIVVALETFGVSRTVREPGLRDEHAARGGGRDRLRKSAQASP